MNPRNPESMSAVIGNVLRYGVILSALIIALGILRLGTTASYTEVSSFLAYNPSIPHDGISLSLSGLMTGVASLDPVSLIELGIMVLIATPVSRVMISILLFGAEKDRQYVLITSVVLALLLFSMLVTPFIPGFHA